MRVKVKAKYRMKRLLMAESEIKMDLLIYIEGMRDSFGTDRGMQDAI